MGQGRERRGKNQEERNENYKMKSREEHSELGGFGKNTCP